MTAAIRRAVPAGADAILVVPWGSRAAVPWLMEPYAEVEARDWTSRVLLVTMLVLGCGEGREGCQLRRARRQSDGLRNEEGEDGEPEVRHEWHRADTAGGSP